MRSRYSSILRRLSTGSPQQTRATAFISAGTARASALKSWLFSRLLLASFHAGSELSAPMCRDLDPRMSPIAPRCLTTIKSRIQASRQIVRPQEMCVEALGQSCTHGQECLLDTMCNGTICVCNEGLFTLQIGDTYNCVPDDPAVCSRFFFDSAFSF